MRRSPKVAEVLPILYLRGLSTGDFREALPVLLGEDAAGLSATNARLTASWESEYEAFRHRDLTDCDFVYVCADGIHFKLPQHLRPRAKRALRDAMYARTKADAETAIGAFVAEFEAKYPKATACLVENQETLLTSSRYPAEYWGHPADDESPFATVRLRQRLTKGAGSRTKGLLMAFKLLEMAQRRCRRLDGAHLLPVVRAGVPFVDGVLHDRGPTGTEPRRRPSDHPQQPIRNIDNTSIPVIPEAFGLPRRRREAAGCVPPTRRGNACRVGRSPGMSWRLLKLG